MWKGCGNILFCVEGMWKHITLCGRNIETYYFVWKGCGHIILCRRDVDTYYFVWKGCGHIILCGRNVDILFCVEGMWTHTILCGNAKRNHSRQRALTKPGEFWGRKRPQKKYLLKILKVSVQFLQEIFESRGDNRRKIIETKINKCVERY